MTPAIALFVPQDPFRLGMKEAIASFMPLSSVNYHANRHIRPTIAFTYALASHTYLPQKLF
jgi:hypothetical protein